LTSAALELAQVLARYIWESDSLEHTAIWSLWPVT